MFSKICEIQRLAVGSLPAAARFVAIFFEAGCFDERYHGASVEEIEFGHRLSKLTPIRFDAGVSVSHHYAHFWKNTCNYFTRTRYWAGLFAERRKFENYGALPAMPDSDRSWHLPGFRVFVSVPGTIFVFYSKFGRIVLGLP